MSSSVPERSGDEEDQGWGDPSPAGEDADDRRLREDRPPHHEQGW